MNDFTIERTKYFVKKYGKEPLADFGGGMKRSQYWMAKNLPSLGIPTYTIFDIWGVRNPIDLTKELVKERFNTILCLDTLEHVRDPFFMAKNIFQALNPGGYALLSVPFNWKRHVDVSSQDYFRFTEDGLRALFYGLDVEFIDEAKRVMDKGELVSIILRKNG